jgi:tetratricopeptide (TPR) repeat protein
MKMNEIQLSRLIDQARSFVQEEKYLHAIQFYQKLILNEPSFLLPYLELAGLYADMGRQTSAIQLLSEADPAVAGSTEIIFLLGTLHSQTEQYDRAIAYFNRLIHKKLPQVHFQLGVANFFKNNLVQAEEQFRQTLKLDPHFPKINESLGELLIKRKAYTEAVTFLKKGIDADPYSAVNHFLLGVAHSCLYNWKSAYNEYVIAVDMDPHEPQHWQLCGETLIQLKRYDEAEPYLRKALELFPQSVEALVALGKIFSVRGDSIRSGEFLKKARSINPVSAREGESRWKIRQSAKRTEP